MRKIYKEEYLHIQRKHGLELYQWNTGDQMFIGTEKNDFSKYFELRGKSIVNPSGYGYNVNETAEIMLRHMEDGLRIPDFDFYHYDPKLTIKELLDSLYYYVRLVRELIFEEVRIEKFPEYPSRQKGIWVIPNNPESLKYWRTQLQGEAKVFKVQLTGIIHQASDEYLRPTTNSLSYWREMAMRYWSGVPGKHNHEEECLFEGYVEVLNEVDDQSESVTLTNSGPLK